MIVDRYGDLAATMFDPVRSDELEEQQITKDDSHDNDLQAEDYSDSALLN